MKPRTHNCNPPWLNVRADFEFAITQHQSRHDLRGARIAMCMRVLLLTILIALCSSQTRLDAQSFLGSSAVLTSRYPTISSPADLTLGPVTVGPGVEFPAIGTNNQPPFYSWSSDVTASTIEITEVGQGNFSVGAPFNGFQYTFTGAPTISGVTFDPSSTLSVTSLSFSANTVEINYAGTLIFGPLTTIVDVTFVPEPATASILMVAIGLISIRRRRRFLPFVS